jgi:urea transport system ATP-binding protein
MGLEVPEGSCTCLMGRNGVGKTTLLRAIMGAARVKSGKIRFGNTDLAASAPELRARRGIGYVPQGREIFASLTVAENLELGVVADGRRKPLPPRVYELFPVLKSMLHRRGGDLSGGQQQQLAIGRALAIGPKLLILDEPTEGIQPNIVREIGDVLTMLNKEEGLTVLLVEQKLAFARRVASRFCLMERGRAVASGAMSELSDDLVSKHLAV